MNRKLVYSGLFAAFAVILSYIEYIIPFNAGIMGVKLGLANFAVLIVIYYVGAVEGAAVNLIRIMVIGMLFGNAVSITFSVAGAFLSFIVMILCKKSGMFGIVAVSVAGSVSHNIGQLFVAALIMRTYAVFTYMPVLIISGVTAGVIIGFLVKFLDKRILKILKYEMK